MLGTEKDYGLSWCGWWTPGSIIISL